METLRDCLSFWQKKKNSVLNELHNEITWLVQIIIENKESLKIAFWFFLITIVQIIM